jgi:hypothetical protein
MELDEPRMVVEFAASFATRSRRVATRAGSIVVRELVVIEEE